MKNIKFLGIIIILIIFTSIVQGKSTKSYEDSMHYSFNTKTVDINYKSNIGTYNIQFSYNGINKLMGLSKLAIKKGSKNILINASTDWVGPYIVQEVITNSNKSIKEQFTGGWHGTNGDWTGNPTAECKDVEIVIDEKSTNEKTKGQGFANKIQIKVTNQIKSFNSNEYVLEETVMYTIIKNNINIQVKTVALKKCEILKYYGLQIQNTPWASNVKYTYNDKTEKTAKSKEENNSGAPHDKSLEKTTISAENLQIIAWIDQSVGLGTFKYLGQSLPYAFTSEYGKTYYNLINGEKVHLNKNDSIEWSGGYIIK